MGSQRVRLHRVGSRQAGSSSVEVCSSSLTWAKGPVSSLSLILTSIVPQWLSALAPSPVIASLDWALIDFHLDYSSILQVFLPGKSQVLRSLVGYSP